MTLVHAFPFTDFYITSAKLSGANETTFRNLDLSTYTVSGTTATVSSNTITVVDLKDAIQTFTITTSPTDIDLTALGDNAMRTASGRVNVTAEIAFRLYVGRTDKFIEDATGIWMLFAQRNSKKFGMMFSFGETSQPYETDGGIQVTATLRNAGRKVPKWA